MTIERILTAAVLALFAAFNLEVLWQYGYVGAVQQILGGLPGWLAFADLTIALSLVLVWMWRDARAHGRTVLPYAALTLAFGSVGPLLYLLLRRDAATAE